MKKIIFLIALIASLMPIKAHASNGSIEMQLPKEISGIVRYDKVATMVNGKWQPETDYKESKIDINAIQTAQELEVAAKMLSQYMEEEKTYNIGEKQNILRNLDEGLYLLIFEQSDDMEIAPILVSIPGWTGDSQIYDVKLIPKYKVIPKSPKTGDDRIIEVYFIGALISFAIIAGLSCHKRFKCGRISFKCRR